MKKYLLIVLLASPLLTLACDICGCGVGNNYIGILPEFRKHIFGLRYRYNSLLTHVGVDGAATYLTTNETYHTIEAWGGYNIGDRFRLMASVPYSFNQRSNQATSSSKNGIGDMAISAYYQMINNRHTLANTKLLVQSLWIGGGAKVGTGKYNPLDKSASGNNANLFQLGTGSTDFNLGFMYDVRLQDAGLNLASNYKITTANQYHYRYGNKFNINSQAYYKVSIKGRFSIAPNAGLQYETAGYDRDNRFKVNVSGGSLFLGTAGLETVLSNLAVGANFQTPLAQNLANGIVKAKNRLMLHVSLAL